MMFQVFIMIYLVSFSSHFKVGYASNMAGRMGRGFWHNLHPPQLCGRLDEFVLDYVFKGSLEIEKALHAALQPDVGEFYASSRFQEVSQFLFNALEFLSAPRWTVSSGIFHRRSRYQAYGLGDLRSCCGGRSGAYVTREHHRRAKVTVGQRRACAICGQQVSIRIDHLKRHQRSSNCVPPMPRVRRRWAAGVLKRCGAGC